MSSRSDSVPRSHMFVKRSYQPTPSVLSNYPTVGAGESLLQSRPQSIARSSTVAGPGSSKIVDQSTKHRDTDVARDPVPKSNLNIEDSRFQPSHSPLVATRSLPLDHVDSTPTTLNVKFPVRQTPTSVAQTLQQAKATTNTPTSHPTVHPAKGKDKQQNNTVDGFGDNLIRNPSTAKQVNPTGDTCPKPNQDLIQLVQQMIKPIIDNPGQLAYAAINTLASHYPEPSLPNLPSSGATLQDIIMSASSSLINDPAQVAHSAVTTLIDKINKFERQVGASEIPQDSALAAETIRLQYELNNSEHAHQALQHRFKEERAIRINLEQQLKECQDQVGCLTEELAGRQGAGVKTGQGYRAASIIGSGEQDPRKKRRVENKNEQRSNECLVEDSDKEEEGSLSLD